MPSTAMWITSYQPAMVSSARLLRYTSIFGSGHKDEGKTYLKNQYLVNKAIDTVTEKANVTFEDGSAAPDTSSGSADAE